LTQNTVVTELLKNSKKAKKILTAAILAFGSRQASTASQHGKLEVLFCMQRCASTYWVLDLKLLK
jgi:hypothetical protein